MVDYQCNIHDLAYVQQIEGKQCETHLVIGQALNGDINPEIVGIHGDVRQLLVNLLALNSKRNGIATCFEYLLGLNFKRHQHWGQQIHVYMYVYIYICVHVYIYINIHLIVQIYTYIYIYVYIDMNIFDNHIYIYTVYIYIDTLYIYIYTHHANMYRHMYLHEIRIAAGKHRLEKKSYI